MYQHVCKGKNANYLGLQKSTSGTDFYNLQNLHISIFFITSTLRITDQKNLVFHSIYHETVTYSSILDTIYVNHLLFI